jgi:anti-anti-sigma regulatory factor
MLLADVLPPPFMGKESFEFRAHCTNSTRIAHIELRGNLERSAELILENAQRATAQGCARIILDMSKVSVIDEEAVQAIHDLWLHSIQDEGADMRLCGNIQDHIRSALRGLDQFIQTCETVNEAEASFDQDFSSDLVFAPEEELLV